MNGFESKGLDEDSFGPKSSLAALKTFDAFRKYLEVRSKQVTHVHQPKPNPPTQPQPEAAANGPS
jgi:hypothetical protein